MRAVDGIVLTPSVRATVQSRWNIRSRCEPARKTDCCDGCLTGQDDTARRETLAETGRFFGLAGVDYVISDSVDTLYPSWQRLVCFVVMKRCGKVGNSDRGAEANPGFSGLGSSTVRGSGAMAPLD